MPDFHKTPMGRTFFESTLPRLVDALEELTGAVKESNALKRKQLNQNSEGE